MRWIIVIYVLFCGILNPGIGRAQTGDVNWPERFLGSFGFEVERSPESRIFVSRIDTASDAFTKGIRTGMEILGWNRLPVNDALQKIKTRRYRKLFQNADEDQIRLLLLPRSRPGETAEVFILTGSGNNRGIRLIAK